MIRLNDISLCLAHIELFVCLFVLNYTLAGYSEIISECMKAELRTSVSGAASYFDKRFLQMQILVL